MDFIGLGMGSLAFLLLFITLWSFRDHLKSKPQIQDSVSLTREGVADQKRLVTLLEEQVALQREANRLLGELLTRSSK